MIGGDPTSGTPTEDEGASFTVLQLHSRWPGATIHAKTVMRPPCRFSAADPSFLGLVGAPEVRLHRPLGYGIC